MRMKERKKKKEEKQHTKIVLHDQGKKSRNEGFEREGERKKFKRERERRKMRDG